MKKLFTSFMLLMLFSVAHSQSLEKQVFASSGNDLANANNQLNFTIGESLVSNVTSASNTIEQGFWKSAAQITLNVNDFIENNVELILYPNPVTDYLNIRFKEQTQNEFKLQLVDILGRSQNIISTLNSQSDNIVNVSNLAKGTYILNFTDTTTNKRISYKIIKN
jgi:hypothetical protein